MLSPGSGGTQGAGGWQAVIQPPWGHTLSPSATLAGCHTPSRAQQGIRGDAEGFARWALQQPTLDLPSIPQVTEFLLPCCSQAVQGCDLRDRDDQTGFPSSPKNPVQGCNYPYLKSEGSLTLQVCQQHPEVLGSESRLGEQRSTAGMGCDEPGMGERRRVGAWGAWSCQGWEGRGRNRSSSGQGAVSLGNTEDKFLPS